MDGLSLCCHGGLPFGNEVFVAYFQYKSSRLKYKEHKLRPPIALKVTHHVVRKCVHHIAKKCVHDLVPKCVHILPQKCVHDLVQKCVLILPLKCVHELVQKCVHDLVKSVSTIWCTVCP